jgi:hypothetical protein
MDNSMKKAKLIEIDKSDNSQLYECEDGFTIWLTGINRANNVEVGDSGILEFITGSNFGLWFFTKTD